MNLQEIYNSKKRIINEGYMEFYNILKEELENDEDFTLADDEMGELIVDLMLSNVLGEITTFDEVSKLLLNSKK